MDFLSEINRVLLGLNNHQIRYSLIGGLAMANVGYMRATNDLDLLVHVDDLASLETILIKSGFKEVFTSSNVITFFSDTALGRIDVLIAQRAHAFAMLERSISHTQSTITSCKALIAEDIIGLKVQATSNDPSRRGQDMADIEQLLRQNQQGIDLAGIREYFKIFNRENELDELLERIKNA